VRWF